jgi:uncharacterized protein YjiS (DUF1127 family)
MWLVSNLLTWTERSHLQQELLRLDARLLEDAGYSRELLEAGVAAWPWRLPGEPAAGCDSPSFGRRLTEADYADAVAELEACSNADLQDLGLSRAAICEAVRHGRRGFPEDRRQAA